MISRAQALEFVSALRDCPGDDFSQEIPKTFRAIRDHLQKAEERWQEGKGTAALHHIGSIAAFSIRALEQHGEDIRDDDPEVN